MTTPALDPREEAAMEIGVEALRKELLRQASVESLYSFEDSDWAVDGHLDPHALVLAILRAMP